MMDLSLTGDMPHVSPLGRFFDSYKYLHSILSGMHTGACMAAAISQFDWSAGCGCNQGGCNQDGCNKSACAMQDVAKQLKVQWRA